jgi:hypothetical protein
VDPSGTLVQEIYNLFASGKFASNTEIERALESGDIGLVNVQSGVLLELKNAAEFFGDPQAMALSNQGFAEGYYDPAVEATTARFTSFIGSQMAAGASLSEASSNTLLAGLFFGDQIGVTPLLEGLGGVDLASNETLSSGEAWRRTIQGGTMVFIAAAAPMCRRGQSAASGATGAGAGDISLPVLNKHFVPNARSLLQKLVNSVNGRFARDLRAAASVLSEKEFRLGQSNPRLAPAEYGNALERMLAEQVAGDPLLSQLFRHTGRGPRPDFVGIGSAKGQRFDITTNTARSMAEHLRRPYGNDLTIITYERPLDFRVFP